jgi:hypothetical protein
MRDNTRKQTVLESQDFLSRRGHGHEHDSSGTMVTFSPTDRSHALGTMSSERASTWLAESG